MIYMPFGRTRLRERVADRDVPEGAAEFGAETRTQFVLKVAESIAPQSGSSPSK